MVYVLHGAAALLILTLTMTHVYFSLLPEKRAYLRAMIGGQMTREEAAQYHDPARWSGQRRNDPQRKRHMNQATLTERLEAIESGYEFSLAYAAQGRTDDAGTQLRPMLQAMHAALEGLGTLLVAAMSRDASPYAASTRRFLDAAGHDAGVAQGAIGLVLDQPAISSMLVDNLNASIHLRALLTDLFLVDQARKNNGVIPHFLAIGV